MKNDISIEGGSGSELKVIGTYDNNYYFTRAVEFNAGSNGTGAKKGRGLFHKVDSIEYWKARGRDAMKGVQ